MTANGRPYEVMGPTSVDAFIRERGLDPQYVVVERNIGALIARRRQEEEARGWHDRAAEQNRMAAQADS